MLQFKESWLKLRQTVQIQMEFTYSCHPMFRYLSRTLAPVTIAYQSVPVARIFGLKVLCAAQAMG
jgi:hypothetical protein